MSTKKPLRAKLASSVSRSAAALSRATGRGDGSVIGGRLGLMIDPNLLANLAAGRDIALISGTNGKTTTTRLTAAALGVRGEVATNSFGANMPTGHTSALARAGDTPYAVLEVDEHYLPQVLAATRPKVVALLNLSRDQLDRAKEVAMIAELWRDTLAKHPVHVVANADDPMIVWAAQSAAGVTWVAAGQRWHDDSWVCPQCGAHIERDDGTSIRLLDADSAPIAPDESGALEEPSVVALATETTTVTAPLVSVVPLIDDTAPVDTSAPIAGRLGTPAAGLVPDGPGADADGLGADADGLGADSDGRSAGLGGPDADLDDPSADPTPDRAAVDAAPVDAAPGDGFDGPPPVVVLVSDESLAEAPLVAPDPIAASVVPAPTETDLTAPVPTVASTMPPVAVEGAMTQPMPAVAVASNTASVNTAAGNTAANNLAANDLAATNRLVAGAPATGTGALGSGDSPPAVAKAAGEPDADWWCTNCTLRRPTPEWRLEGDAVIDPSGRRHIVVLALPGRVNRANAATALAVASRFGVDPADAVPRLGSVASIAGRYAQVDRDGRNIRLLLAKNPAGWLEAFDMAEDAPTLLSINSRDPDGLDTSWLFDVDFSPLDGRQVFITGDRAFDLAVRLEVNDITFTHVRTFAEVVATVPPGRLEVIANYTAFQDIRAELDRVN